MAIVNAQYQIILCDSGTNARISSHGGILQNTKFFQRLQNNEFNNPSQKIVSNSSWRLPYVFVADDAFPLSSDMMKPFWQAELDSVQKTYRVSWSRRIVENAFDSSVTRFWIFHTEIIVNPSKNESFLRGCCALDSFLIKKVRNSYSSPNWFDHEQIDTGIVI